MRDYDGRRAEVIEALTRLRPHADMSTVQSIYATSGTIDFEARRIVNEMATRFSTLVRMPGLSAGKRTIVRAQQTARQVGSLFAPFVPARVWELRRRAGIVTRPKRSREPWLGKLENHFRRASGLSERAMSQIKTSRQRELHRRHMLSSAEVRIADLRIRLNDLSRRIPDGLVNRVPLYLELARLERRIGHDMIAATYLLRIMRWLGKDQFGTLPYVAATLRRNDCAYEAETAEAMFGARDQTEQHCYHLVQTAYERNRRKAELPLAVLDDRRGTEPRRVCVVASLYKAADKLPTLLAMLANQTLALRGELEVVLVDSNSPADEYGAMEAFLRDHALPVAYARSENRETIQAAWNRGIHLSRAPYLCFIGADEGLHPDALRQLADALDADTSVDWAMADSLVTNVDRHGVYDSDIMPYDRRGYLQDLVYLDTTYLSWVGGLYRRTIHDRFGYYDETFRAAGDTEFKNRIMPHIRSVRVPKMLGVFNNYPEERTTQSPRAEIEDLRAWYLWRTAGGLRYAFDQRPAEDATALLRTALNYRKAFCGHYSSDFDLASALSVYLAGRPDAPEGAATLQDEMANTIGLMRSIEMLPANIMSRPRGFGTAAWVYRRVQQVRQLGARHRQLLDLPVTPTYEVFNDNRHEQHCWSWSN